MTTNTPTRRLAVLIDGDSPSPEIADPLFEHVTKRGQAIIRRIYGDFSQPQLRAWAGAVVTHAIVPHQQGRNTWRKNATDIALVIDAMDILHGGRVDGFCIVSSDGDFTRLAARIREQGLVVYGFGSATAPESFRTACAEFIELTARPSASKTEATRPEPVSSLTPKPDLPGALLHLIQAAIGELDSEEGWYALAALGSRLVQLHPDYRAQAQGYKKLADIVRATHAFELEQRTGKGWWIRPTKRCPGPAAG